MRSVGAVIVGISALCPCLIGAPAGAQVVDGGRAHPPRIYNTQRLTGQPPSIDGHLDDDAWKEGEWAGDYTQQLPVEGGKPSQKTELKILYDEKYIYFAIRAHDDMSKVAKYSSRRDEIAGDIVGVCFDSYFDKRTGFEFDITSAGTKIDLVLSNEGWDTTWDAVWDGKVAYEADAWTAEFRIPLSQLRYGPQDAQIWGMHAWRWIDRFQEESQWNLIPRQGTGRLYNFGELHGIHGLKPRRRIELLPHVLGQVESLPEQTGNPYVGPNGTGALGLDAKVGLSSNFTMDATVNPDFGQVEADPSVVNLTTYETFYEEKRPFFLEGKRIFTLGLAGTAKAGDESGTLEGDQLFYSRRIGAPPTIRPALEDGAFLETPGQTSIISAVKVTGKTKDGLSVGLLQSVTDDEHANVWFNGLERKVPVAPTTNYVVGRVQKDWNKGNSILGGMFTSTHRWLQDDAALRELPTDSFTGAVDATQFFGDRSYVVEGKGVFSRIGGDASAIRALQTNPVHFYQRPDASHLGVDPNATSMLGHAGTVRVARYGKSKWLWSESVRWMSPGLELNDVGYLRQADVILNEASLEFKEIEPRGVFRSVRLLGHAGRPLGLWGAEDDGQHRPSGERRIPEPVDCLGGSDVPRGPRRHASLAWWSGHDDEPAGSRGRAGEQRPVTPGQHTGIDGARIRAGRRRPQRQRDRAGQHAACECVLSLGHRVVRAQRRRSAVCGHRPSRRITTVCPRPARSGHTRSHVPRQRLRVAGLHDPGLRQSIRVERRLRHIQTGDDAASE